MLEFFEKKEKVIYRFIFVGVVLAAIKSIFTDTGFDNAYTVAMSYRHLGGDRMFKEMWEPHQTSIFFTDILMGIYHKIVPSYTGVMIYLQVCGTLLLALLGYLLYRLLRDYSGERIAKYAGLFFFIFRAKQTPFPDFANLQISFSVFLFLCVIKVMKDEQKWWFFVFAGMSLCLEVLSYPSAVITAFPIIIFILIKTEKKVRNVLIFSFTCISVGVVYVSYFAIKLGISSFVQSIKNIIFSDSHSGERIGLYTYFSGIVVALMWLAVSYAISYIITKIVRAYKGNDFPHLPVWGIVLFFSELVMLLMQKKTGIDWNCTFYILPLFLIVISGICGYKKMTDEEKNIWILGVLISTSSFFATALLTDLGIITVVAYMVLGAVVSFIPLKYCGKHVIIFIATICALVTMHRGLVIWGYANRWGVWMVYDVEGIITEGPSIGIVCDYMRYYQTKCDIEDHRQYVGKDDTIFLVDYYVYDPIEFMLTDAKIGNFSTIDTPIYNETMLEYFNQNPEKYPTVVAVSCWYGNIQIDPNSWIMKWVDENYEVAGDGRYWRYYRQRE